MTVGKRGRPRQTHCMRGHPLSGANLIAGRKCRACAAERHAAWRAANPERWREISNGAKRRSRARRAIGPP